jgi:hypothetical protein
MMKNTLQCVLLCVAVIASTDAHNFGQETSAVVEKYGPVPTEIGALGQEGRLLLAIRAGNVETVARFLDAGNSPDTRIDITYTWGDISFIPNDKDAKKTHISACPPRREGKTVWRNLRVCHRYPTLLEEAVRTGQTSVARLLIDYGAEVDLPNYPGRNTPLMYAAMQNTELVELLIDSGADIDAANSTGETALILAERTHCGKNVELLKKAGATR